MKTRWKLKAQYPSELVNYVNDQGDWAILKDGDVVIELADDIGMYRLADLMVQFRAHTVDMYRSDTLALSKHQCDVLQALQNKGEL